MKQYLFTPSGSRLFGMILLFVLFSCHQESPVQPEDALTKFSDSQIELTHNTIVMGLRMPDQSSIVWNDDRSSVTFRFPDKVFFVEENSIGEVVLTPEKNYVCKCSASGGCDVYHVQMGGNDLFGCLHGTCSGSCTGSFSDNNDPGQDRPIGGFIDFNQGISFVKSDKEAEPLLPFHPILLELPKVQHAMKLLRAMTHSQVAEKKPTIPIAMNFYGTLMAYELPVAFIEQSSEPWSFREISCNCTNGSDGCEYLNLGDVNICLGGNCSSCQMTVEGPPKD